jgi:hypothetical protein
MTQTTKVAHRTVKVRDQDIFYREAVSEGRAVGTELVWTREMCGERGGVIHRILP